MFIFYFKEAGSESLPGVYMWARLSSPFLTQLCFARSFCTEAAVKYKIMKFERNNLIIERSDWHYVSGRFINFTYSEVKAFFEKHKHAFIQDKYQLANALGGTSFKELFKVLKETEQYYQRLRIKRKNGKSRIVYKVKSPLKSYQYFINRNILQKYEISKYATAYYKGASIKKNAELHCRKKYLLKMDLSDFFGHITEDMVRSCVFNKNHFPLFICYVLTRLCTYKGFIVQGAVTSPAISNVVMKHFDDVMGEWCSKQGISFSRYSDDITFSSDKKLYSAYCKAKSLLKDMGFEINEAKTKYITNASRQTVNGIVVNEVPRVDRNYRRKLRQEIYYALKYSPLDCQIHCGELEKVEEDGQLYICCNKTEAAYVQSILGRISWVLQINPEDKFFKNAKDDLLNMYASCF